MLAFLDAYLKDDSASLEFLQKRANKNKSAVDEVFSISYKQAMKAAPSEEELFRILEKKDGVKKARQIYLAVKSREPDHKIFQEHTLSRLARFQNDINISLDIYKMVADAYPNSFWAVYNIGSAQRKLGDKKDALHSFENALSVLKEDENIDEGERSKIEKALLEELDELKRETGN